MNEATRNEVVHRWRTGASMRSIARALGLARHTVRRAGRRGSGAGRHAAFVVGPATSLLDPYESVMVELLGRYTACRK